MIVGIGPSEVWRHTGMMGRDAVRIRTLLTTRDVSAQRLWGCSDRVGEVAVRCPAPSGKASRIVRRRDQSNGGDDFFCGGFSPRYTVRTSPSWQLRSQTARRAPVAQETHAVS